MKHEKQQHGFNFSYFLIKGSMMALWIVSIGPAATLTVTNPDFETGDGEGWTKSPNIYFNVEYNEPGTIMGQAASIKSTGSEYLYQEINAYSDSYDLYKINFDLGYRCDTFRGGDIDAVRVSLIDSVTLYEVAGEDIIVGQPYINDDQVPNVDTIVSRRVVLRVDRNAQMHNKLLLFFSNSHSETNPSKATAVLDNIVVRAYRKVAHWPFTGTTQSSLLSDLTDEHNLSPLPGKSVGVGTPGVGNTGNCFYLRSPSPYLKFGAYTAQSSSFNNVSFSLTAWAWMPSSWSNWGNYQSLVCYRQSYGGFTLYANSNDDWSFWTGNGSSWDKQNGPSIIPDQWNFIAVTFEKDADYDAGRVIGTKRLYVNGNMVCSTSGVVYKYSVDSANFYVGVGATGAEYYFNGFIDDVRYYNTQLPSLEIADIYAETKDMYTAPDTGEYFNVMSYNIKHGEKSSISAVGAVIDSWNPAVVGVQEIYSNQVEDLADAADMDYFVFGPAAYNGTYGNAILSKYPILTSSNSPLPQSTVGEETRALLVATIEIEGKMYTVANTHLTHGTPFEGSGIDDEFWRTVQMDNILNTLNYCSGVVILTGDFNSRAYWPAIDHSKQIFIDTHNISSYIGGDEGITRIDGILVSHNHFDDNVVLWHQDVSAGASDHYPVVINIEIE
ncbi:MAG: endonuclease/exonuclease/phosphatase family protein [Sedimentisphaerales bacterium]|nr:endonuclease/exonuclease/phosphatase family protein [Sedimentisphaerales bacterium]